jgi:hypothetical protein
MIDNNYNRYINHGYMIDSSANLVCKTEDFIFLKEHKINHQYQRLLSWSSIEKVKKYQLISENFIDELPDDKS